MGQGVRRPSGRGAPGYAKQTQRWSSRRPWGLHDGRHAGPPLYFCGRPHPPACWYRSHAGAVLGGPYCRCSWRWGCIAMMCVLTCCDAPLCLWLSRGLRGLR